MYVYHRFQLYHLVYSPLFSTTYAASRLASISRQFSRQFAALGKMSSGKSLRDTRESGIRGESVGANGPSLGVSTSAKGGYSHVGEKAPQRIVVDNVSGHPKSWAASDPNYKEEWPPLSASSGSSSMGKRITNIDLSTPPKRSLEERPGDIGSSQFQASPVANVTSKDKSLLPTSFGKKHLPSPVKRHKLRQSHPKYSVGAAKTDSVKVLPEVKPFDICLCEIGKSSVLKSSLIAKSKEEQSEMEHPMERNGPVLRPGMVLLKSYITMSEQVQIVKKCQELGLGPGGFYQPGFREGPKLRLHMMCLGLDWDLETRKYQKRRAVDGSEPPGIPHEFSSLVKRAIQASHALIEKDITVSTVEDLFPDMSPNICIVNFYATSGRLGLHQDRDESKESLRKGLPVVSFSVGDSAEFLYGDQRDVDKAEKVILESGDILIFGGKSRHIFHGVTSIIPNSAPPALLEEAKLRPGRLNLTFRQY